MFNLYLQKKYFHDASIQEEGGYTCAMLWINWCKTLPPKQLIHDLKLTNNIGQTLSDLWIHSVNNNVPDALRM